MGCFNSCRCDRAFLARHLPLTPVCHDEITCEGYVHVDDVLHDLHSPTRAPGRLAELESSVIQIGKRFQALASHLKLAISDKSTVVTSVAKLGRSIVRGLRALGVPIKLDLSCEDLGVSSSAGWRRATASLDRRTRKALRRGKRARFLARATRGVLRKR